MSSNRISNTVVKPLDFKIHSLLFFLTGGLWSIIYNLICFKRLDDFSKIDNKNKQVLTANPFLSNTLIYVSFIAAPFVLYRRFKLVYDYVKENSIDVPSMPTEEKEKEEDNPVNCLHPKKYLGFIIAFIIITLITATCYSISIIWLVKYNNGTTADNLWGNGLFMVLLPIALTGTFLVVGFSGRILKEEKKWVHVFNHIISTSKK